MSVQFRDNRMQVKAAMNEAIVAYLHEAGGELESRVKMNTRVGETGDTKGKWKYVVDESKGECIVGNPLQNAIWEEFGTGEFALKGNGRKGGWWYQDKKTNKWHHTFGKTPNRALQSAYDSLKTALIQRARDVLKGSMR